MFRALVDHWSSHQTIHEQDTILDVGCGSGIQALSLAARSSLNPQTTCVDINQRALRITQLNFDWNGFDAPTLLHGDIIQSPTGKRILIDGENVKVQEEKPWRELIQSAKYIVSNPPFLPVPVYDDTIASRYGLFSSGGSTGEEFFESLVRLAFDLLDQEHVSSATLGVVSEFMNPSGDFGRRLSSWWSDNSGDAPGGHALLLTNENALDAAEYAKRRADSPQEALQWNEHLRTQGIDFISPGLMFLKRKAILPHQEKDEEDTTASLMDLTHVVVPKTTEGSIWTPTNRIGRDFTRCHIEEFSRRM